MNKIGFIYPEWMAAKRHLYEAIVAGPTRNISWNDHVYDCIDRWLKRHLFEIGFSVDVAHENFYRGDRKDLENHIKSMAGRRLADEILNKDMFIRETVTNRDDPYTFPSKVYSYRILAFACPLLVGPGTREAKVLQMENPE